MFIQAICIWSLQGATILIIDTNSATGYLFNGNRLVLPIVFSSYCQLTLEIFSFVIEMYMMFK